MRKLEKVQNFLTRRVFYRCFGTDYINMSNSQTKKEKLGVLSINSIKDPSELNLLFKLIKGESTLSDNKNLY